VSRPLARRLTVVAAVGSCLAAAALPALAAPEVSGSPSGVDVSTQIGQSSSRQLQLLQLSGEALEELGLRPGVPAPFRVQVTDTGVNQLTSADSGFTVQSVLNNLYLDGVASADFIPSLDVRVDFPAGGAQNAVGSLVALPRTVISGELGDCVTLKGALASLSSLNLLSGPGLALCDALGLTGITIEGITVLTSTEKTLTDLAAVPFSLGGQQSGAYTDADYGSGIGFGDSRKTGKPLGTTKALLVGAPSISSALQDQLDGLKAQVQGSLKLVSPDGTDAQTDLETVIGVLLTTPATAALGNALAGLTPTQASDILNTLTGLVEDIGLGDILSVNGVYNAFPVLTADPQGDPAQGTYRGTMTVTLVQP
jgi:hypothetical protein